MSDTPAHPTSIADAPWYTPTIVMQLADGTTWLKPGKPIQRASADQTAKWTGVSTKTLKRLAEVGYIRVSKPTPWLIFYYPGEVEDFIARTEADPDFWDEARKNAYLEGRHMREKKPPRTGELPGLS